MDVFHAMLANALRGRPRADDLGADAALALLRLGIALAALGLFLALL